MDFLLDWAAHGLLHARFGAMVLYTLVSTHFTIIAATLYLHRDQTHRSLELRAPPAHLCRFWLWLSTGITTRVFVAVHRMHHGHCDTAADPHSPVIHGMRRVLWRGSELYRAAARDARKVRELGWGTPDDWVERRVYARHPDLGIALLLALELVWFGLPGLSVWAVQMLWMPVLAAGVLNSAGHFWGYRNYAVGDTSHNFFPLGLLIGGEELHNNHHANPGAAKFSARWFEFDVGWVYIRILCLCGLAKVVGPALAQPDRVGVR
jgi:stearoyl-CoA desaturase (delta-9 desaturase)